MPDGVTLVGRYRLDELLGRGAMGEVWRGLDLRLGREVAVKILPDHLTAEPRRVTRFRNEAKIGAVLQHPGIVVVFDTDEHEGQLFFVMELLAGEDLAKILARSRGGLPMERALKIAAQLAEALAAAHHKGVIHRDIKPANVMVMAADRTKICDFGIARIVESSGGEGTSGIGTAPYMAPEQFGGGSDERGDLYSLGCVLNELLTGDRPFLGAPQELMYHHMCSAPLPPTSVRPDIPVELEDLVLELLAKDREQRPQKAEEVAERLEAIRRQIRRSGNSSADKPITEAAEVVSSPTPPMTKRLYNLPSLTLLHSGSPVPRRTEANEAAVGALTKVLVDNHVDARVVGFTRGPSISLYEIRLGPMTKAEAIIALSERMSAVVGQADVQIIPSMRSSSPLPDVAAVGVEIPNVEVDSISLGDVLRSEAALAIEHPLVVGLGTGVDGTPIVVNLALLPHLLIGGTAGSGEPSCVRALVTSILMHASPDEVRMLLVDSKAGRLAPYGGIPHLIDPVITDPQSTVKALHWAEAELDRRYDDMAGAGCRDIDAYNQGVRLGRVPAPMNGLGDIDRPHPYIVVVIDELAEPRRAAPREIEKSLMRLTQLGRAVGMHLVLGTTSPTEQVVTDRIKAHIPSRLGSAGLCEEASQRVLDHSGTKSPVHVCGAMFRPKGADIPQRLNLARVADKEIAAVVDHCRRQV